MILNAWISAGPSGMPNIFPELSGLYGFCNRAICFSDQFPIIICFNGSDQMVGMIVDAQLKEALRARQLPIVGTKAALIRRLADDRAAAVEAPE